MKRKLNPQELAVWRSFLTVSTRLVTQIDLNLQRADQIPLNWYDVLLELYEAPEKRLRMSELAERVLLTRSGLTRLVDRLEKAGLLTREIDPEDRRGFYATITDSGINAMRKAWPIYAGGIIELFAEHLSDEETALLANIFNRMLANL
jgi:DNA-binding MarR family transcriptional regulator